MKNGEVKHDPWINKDYTYNDSIIHGYYKITPKQIFFPNIKHQQIHLSNII